MFPVSLPGLAHAQHTPLVHQTGPFRPVEFLLVPKHLHSLPGGGVPHQKIFRVASLNWGQSFHWGLAAWPVPGLSSIHAPSCPLVEDASASRALQAGKATSFLQLLLLGNVVYGLECGRCKGP